MADWSPEQYLKFEDERTRPARDLLAQIPVVDARRVVDIGCGPGNSTELLARRWPLAAVTGVDTSADMLRQARERLPGHSFIEANIAHWAPPEHTDVLFANAIFQWVPGHLRQLQRLLGALSPGGVLAVQMPDNTAEPAIAVQRAVAAHGPWADKLARAEPRAFLLPVEGYYDLLKPHCARIEIWHGIYNHVMAAPQAIVEWFKGSSLQPYMALLDAPMREKFLAAYSEKIAAAYPRRVDGTVLLKFPRLFIVAVR